MLAQSVARDFGGRVRFVSENYGESALAKRFGVTFYPAIFVDDVLVATPKDFFNMNPAAKGRYIPFKTAESHERFRSDLARMTDLVLAGKKEEARALASPGKFEAAPRLPSISLTDLDGRRLPETALAGRVVLVEFWATWCPPCRATLGWLGSLKERYGDRLAVVAVSVESDPSDVRKRVRELGLPLTWALGTPEVLSAFGDIPAVPVLFLFDRAGASAGTYFGAPPDLHERAEANIASLLR